jgi:hypothetical protein
MTFSDFKKKHCIEDGPQQEVTYKNGMKERVLDCLYDADGVKLNILVLFLDEKLAMISMMGVTSPAKGARSTLFTTAP